MMTQKLKTYLLLLLAIGATKSTYGQATIYPAPEQQESITIQGATLHIGNGQVIENGSISFDKGRITYVGQQTASPTGKVIDAKGKHVYPGFIAPITNLGLAEIEAVRATLDYAEVGDLNAHVRALIAYNTDSKVINTVRSNGVLLAQVTPQGGLISGQSSVVQLDAWNWEDAAYKADDGMHIRWPEARPSRFVRSGDNEQERIANQVALIESFISQARAYSGDDKDQITNARLKGFGGVFDQSTKVYLHANSAEAIVSGVKSLKKQGLTPILVGGGEAHLLPGFLKENGVPVIIQQSHRLPSQEGDDVYLPYKQAKVLSDQGVLVAYSVDGYWQQRNLPFMAGTAAGYGLSKEEALSTITLNAAKIMGIDEKTGSLEVGKDANLFVSTGDALDMRGNNVEQAFIAGREIDTDNLHKQLFERYEHKYSSENSEK